MTIAFTLLEQTCLTKQANKTLPPHANAVKIANDMGDYFVQKIPAIRSKMAASTQSPPSAAQESDYTTTLNSRPNFLERAPLIVTCQLRSTSQIGSKPLKG